ncbi:MAG TPA: Gfo/Idh/MocA family oxidoreductase [Opitutaceae bacterium]|nr:Gfo/Idh/MocA family oxidoreductase [Lacunisphaera sp.]HWA09194.1 Gfo/Idh/MocA family oxidoreductase [Opitutaceae bacterium]
MLEPPRTLKAAVIGCGRIGVAKSERLLGKVHPTMLPVSHAESILANDQLRLIAFCDIDRAKAAQAAALYHVPGIYTDMLDMLAAERPDLVSVATRTLERPGIVRELARRGVKGVYADKPFSRNLGECLAAMQAVEAAGANLVLGTQRRYSGLYRRARELAWSGDWGRLVRVTIHLEKDHLLMWSTPHLVDLLLFLTGGRDVDYLQATCAIPDDAVHGSTIDCDPVVEEATLRFDNDVQGSMLAGRQFAVNLVCEEAEILVREKSATIIVVRASGPGAPSGPIPTQEVVNDVMSGTQRAFTELAASILGREKSPVSLAELMLHQRILLGLPYSSLREGRRIRLKEIPDDFTVTGRFRGLYA